MLISFYPQTSFHKLINMTPYLRFIVDGTNCDLPTDGFSFEINKRINDGLQPAGGNLTRSVPLPSTKVNDAVFDRWFSATENNQNGISFKPCTLISNGLVLLDGLSQLTDSTNKFNEYTTRGQEYKVAVKDGNSDPITRLGDLKLSELDWTTDVEALTDANVTAGYTATYPTDTHGYFIAKSRDWVTIPLTFANAGSKAVVPILSTAFVFVDAVIDKIFDYLGLNWASPFLLGTEGKKYIMPILFPEKYGADFSEAYLNVKAVKSVPRTYNAGTTVANIGNIDFTTQTQTPIYGANPLVLSTVSLATGLLTGTYTAKSKGFYKFNLSILLGAIANSATIVIVIGGTSSVANQIFDIAPADTGKTLTFSQILGMDFGQIAEFYVNIDAGDDFTFTSVSLEVIGEAQFTKNTPIDFKYLMFDWKCKDFLRGLGQLFNLQFETSIGLGNVDIDPLDNGFLSGAIDWQTKADTSKTCIDTHGINQNQIIYQYKKDDDDKTVVALENNANLGLYAAQFNVPSTQSEIGIDRQENVFFAATASFYDKTIKTNASLITPLLPLFWAEDFNKQQTFTTPISIYQPRILWFAGQRAGIDGTIRTFNGTASSTISLPAAFMVNYNDLTALDPVLSYDNAFGVGLMQKYFIKSLARQRSNRTRNCSFALNDLDISQLTFTKRIQFDGVWWLLKEIKGYNPLDKETTLVELELDVADTDTDYAAVQNSNIIGFLGYKQ